MTGELVGRFKVDNPDDVPTLLHSTQNIHGIQVHVKDLQAMQIDERLDDFYRCSEMGDRLPRHPFRIDCSGQRKLVEQRSGQEDTAIAKPSVLDDDREISRGRQLAIDRRQTGYLVVEITLVDKPGLGGQFDEHAGPRPFVVANHELMPSVLAMTPTGRREAVYASQVVERWGLEINLEGVAVRHDDPGLRS
jgi:hypothetical protein